MAEVLIIGGGGREVALAQAIEASSEVNRVVISADITQGLAKFSSDEKPFIVIGPEQPLVDGLADELRSEGYTVFGASQQAAQIESSKSFAVERMLEGAVTHPQTVVAKSKQAIDQFFALNRDPKSYVIKADGLAGGKGVVLPDTIEEAEDVAYGMQSGKLFDGAGEKAINFADRHSGPEVSVMAVVGDNDEFKILPPAQDHKRLQDGDKGPNTGGMGAYAPVPESILSKQQFEAIHVSYEKTLKAMRRNNTPFERGLLYGGFMLSEQEDGQPVVIEFNTRFGDPETQVILPLLVDSGVDVYRLLLSASVGNLENPYVHYNDVNLSAMTVCLAAKGYPGTVEKGAQIYGLDREYPGVTVQKAAVTPDDKVNGGRVLYVSATGATLDEAATKAYAVIGENGIHFDGMQYRTDIGYQAR